MARDALRRIDGGDSTSVVGQPRRPAPIPVPSFEIKPFGDPGNHAGPALRSHMRDFLMSQLRPFGDVSPAEKQGTYAVDGVIKSLELAAGGATSR